MKRETRQGTYTATQRGFGFIRPSGAGAHGGREDIFVPAEYTRGAISGDTVEYDIPRRDSKGPVGRVLKILAHGRKSFVGCLAEIDGKYYVRPMDRELPTLIPLAGSDVNGIAVGDWLEAAFAVNKDGSAAQTAVVSRRISSAASAVGDLKAVCREYGLPNLYDREAERNAAELKPMEVPREDCRKLDVFTMDPMDARDYDDAISFQRKGNRAVLGVHIADVACFVPHNSPLDRAARRRGFTSYLPGKTISMLPLALSADLCSLRQGVDRLAHSVFLTIDCTTGRVVSHRRAHTIIRSGHRLCFEQVERLLAGEAQPDIDAALSKKLADLASLAERMRMHRALEEQFLPFDAAEIRVVCTGKPPKVTGIVKTEGGPASRMIEEFMLAANVAVAEELNERRIPAFYRNHAEPSSEELAGIAKLAEVLLHRRKIRLNHRPRLVEFLKEIAEKPGNEVLNMALLRCMARAEYSIANHGHFGLGKPLYCHFTSPIRRYTDLLVHQQLIAADLGGRKMLSKDDVFEMQAAVNSLEMNNDYAAFALSDRLKMRLVQERMAEDRKTAFECLVVKATPSGLSIYIPEYGLMAFMEADSFKGRGWRFDSKSGCIVNGRKRYGFGDAILARPKNIDTVRGELLMKEAVAR
ncbi:MAG: VacB/RNase II family 3'-5' exoribonuclease [Victivallales bacterium]|nr:VacB/RNase II family 3'-5' exoribonuclease [Victivallales bacterium]